MIRRSRQFRLPSIWAAALAGFTVAVLSAAARAAPPLPDFTGVWSTYVESGRAPPGGGGRRSTAPLPFTPEGKRRNDEYKQLLGPEQANSGAYCVDYGMPMMMEMAGGYPLEFIQKGDQLTIIFEVEGETRRVFLGKRGVPEEKRIPSRQGYSVGHWEGKTLVVETTNLLGGRMVVGVNGDLGAPYSDDLKLTERFTRVSANTVSYELIVDDPKTYTATWKVAFPITHEPGYQLFEYACHEGNMAMHNMLNAARLDDAKKAAEPAK
jgi:hypothetical protein